jgi:hypothetical protein
MSKLRTFISIFISIAFLLSSLGFTANKMVCLKSGKTKLSAVPLESCCASEEQEMLKQSCCEINNSYFSLENFQCSSQLKVKVQSIELLWAPVMKTLLPETCSFQQAAYYNLPPLLHSSGYLEYISVHRI